MTASNVHSPLPFRRLATHRVCCLGLAIGLLAVASVATAAAPVPAAVAGNADPARQATSNLEIANIDFKRGDGGAGRLIVRFNGKGAMPDLRNQGSSVIVDVGNAALPAALQRPMNVVDFATPVQRVDAHSSGSGTQVVLSTNGAFESLAYQTGNEYIVEIVPRAAQSAMGASASSSIAAGSARVAAEPRAYKGRPVTFNFQDVPVRTVLQLIAEESNLNIVASDTVQGNVTLRLVNVPWDQALDIVLRAKGLDQRREGGVVWVAPQPELAKFEQDKENARRAMDESVDLITDYVQINYHSASAIFKALTEAKGIGNSGSGGGGGNNDENGFLSQRGRLVADERTNTLMISDIPKKVAQMRELIAVIDRPVDQVLIEGRIVIATDTFARDLGARFGVSGKRQYGDNTAIIGDTATGNTGTGNNRGGLNVNLPAGGFINNPAGSLAYTLLGSNFSLDLELSALQEEGRGEVISNPRLVTANQREAVIRQGREVGYVTITGGTGGSAATPNVQFKEALLELKVTPTITNDGRVFLNLNVKKDEIDSFIDIGNYGSVPQINKREITTAVLVEDGQTVVIGGVYEFTDRSSIAKVPFLGDIPFLGNLFKKKGRSKEKAELLIFITPKVLSVAKR
ncbi:type IV pilus secretin PilQ [Pseudoxanthomonas sacheonensis]|uniref:Type IV pilus assembly protein PilQ n=1 Tax=Pseudoxanthomonas sacheonensis TaxID=443615 RepID=A0ABU1RLY1_9GAMM|nr:type IV pilus secretin PilQ family protein [Pseudoxanthomonas sacheonensis]MDR6839777.1 type IV pilus assembly protein PilQ [Pseudoxanthomonas sacheonensis]